jgi:hypothetical protein
LTKQKATENPDDLLPAENPNPPGVSTQCSGIQLEMSCKLPVSSSRSVVVDKNHRAELQQLNVRAARKLTVLRTIDGEAVAEPMEHRTMSSAFVSRPRMRDITSRRFSGGNFKWGDQGDQAGELPTVRTSIFQPQMNVDGRRSRGILNFFPASEASFPENGKISR